MSKLMDNPSWLEPMPGISPIEDVAKLNPGRSVHLWVGDEDEITSPFLSVEYFERAGTMGKDVSHTVVSGGDHDMILQDEVLDLVLQSIGKGSESVAVDSTVRMSVSGRKRILSWLQFRRSVTNSSEPMMLLTPANAWSIAAPATNFK